ncbi:conserved hypothetical protein [Theileria equi strain WA]|uniref:Uncharacterized protein n=1 Tax=Theileria equi strain WA TaxID=1537102 RepID=L1LCF3_THEEQ|nr:conserved hypothetical protein [Theileria equi strain WA]EKX73122.1 conserved hypothetical protein [Theileria equi strain WA]|eukprot:XP_004832574.1 conserved hypothetical protein [Theileria equi strain WA]
MVKIDQTYDNIVTGSLKLKGSLICKKKNKIVKIPRPEDKEKDFIKLPTQADSSKEDKPEENANIIDRRIKRVKEDPNLTSSEKAFRIAQLKRSSQKIETALKEAHRDKIEKFNTKLSKLSEHFDIPKVGPG